MKIPVDGGPTNNSIERTASRVALVRAGLRATVWQVWSLQLCTRMLYVFHFVSSVGFLSCQNFRSSRVWKWYKEWWQEDRYKALHVGVVGG